MTLDATIKSTTNATLTKVGSLGNGQAPVSEIYSIKFSDDDVSLLYSKRNTLVATSDNLTVNDDSLTDFFGEPLTFVTVRHIQVVNKDATHNLIVGGGSNSLIPAITLGANGCLNLTTAITVSGSAKLLKIDAGANTVQYDVIILGE